jgi:FkbM family methyltransferase
VTVPIYIDLINKNTVISPFTVLEIGSRDGKHALQLANAFGVTFNNLHVIEANPCAYENIVQRFPGICTYNIALSDLNTTLDFYAVDPSEGEAKLGQSSLLEKNSGIYSTIAKKISVESMTGFAFMKKHNINSIDICKIDVEGATLQVLKGFGHKLKDIMSLHVECEHRQVWKGQHLYHEVAAYLINFGFRQIYFNISANVQSDSIWVLSEMIKD